MFEDVGFGIEQGQGVDLGVVEGAGVDYANTIDDFVASFVRMAVAYVRKLPVRDQFAEQIVVVPVRGHEVPVVIQRHLDGFPCEVYCQAPCLVGEFFRMSVHVSGHHIHFRRGLGDHLQAFDAADIAAMYDCLDLVVGEHLHRMRKLRNVAVRIRDYADYHSSSFRRGSGILGFSVCLVGHIEVSGDFLNVVVVIQGLHEPEHLPRLVALDADCGIGDHCEFG